MLELGSSGSVRGVLSNEHPYRHPGRTADIADRDRGRLSWRMADIRKPARSKRQIRDSDTACAERSFQNANA